MTAVVEPVEPTVAPGELLLPVPIGPQVRWMESAAPKKLMAVGRRGSKTRFALIAAMSGHGPGWDDGNPTFPGVLQGGDVVWIAQTYTNLTTVLWREEVEPRMGHLPWITLNKTTHDVTIPGVGSLLLRSGERDAIRSVRGVGKRLRGVIIDEAAWLDLRGALLDIILPALMDNAGWLVIMSTTNAEGDGGYTDEGQPQIPSYFNVLCAEVRDGKRGAPEWEMFTGTAQDNPKINATAFQALVAEYDPGSRRLQQEVYAALLEPGRGLALPGLSEAKHLVPAFSPPPHWPQFASFDWGYHHPWVFGLYCANEDGHVYKIDTLIGRQDLPEQIDAKLRARGVDMKRLTVYAGPDCWQAHPRKMGEVQGPNVAEELWGLGWTMVGAANARIAGLNNLRRYCHVDPARPATVPRFQFMDTLGNRQCLKQMQAMTLDPDDPEDALKVDADASGRGGDDCYDETRYGLMSRPVPAPATQSAFDQDNVHPGFDYEKRMAKSVTNEPEPGPWKVPVTYKMPR